MDDSFMELFTPLKDSLDEDLVEDPLEMSCSNFANINKTKFEDMLPPDGRFSDGPLNRISPGSLEFHRNEKPGAKFTKGKDLLGSKVVMKLIRMIHDKLLSHETEGVVDLTCSLTKYFKGSADPYVITDEILWRLANHLSFYHDRAETISVQENREAFDWTHLNQLQILLESSFQHLLKGNVEAAHSCLEGFEISKSTANKEVLRKQKHEENLEEMRHVMDGYLGLVETQRLVEECGALKGSGELDARKSLDMHEQVKEVILKLERAAGMQGNCWDVFIQGLRVADGLRMDLLEMSGSEEDEEFKNKMEDVLEKYSYCERNNPNAHKYYLEHLYSKSKTDENMDRSELMVKIKGALQRLQEVDPSSEDCIHLHKILMCEAKSSKDKAESCEVLMSALDDPRWKEDEEKWRQLRDSLEKGRGKLRKILRSCYVDSGRKSWWPEFHFNEEFGILPIKREVWEILSKYG